MELRAQVEERSEYSLDLVGAEQCVLCGCWQPVTVVDGRSILIDFRKISQDCDTVRANHRCRIERLPTSAASQANRYSSAHQWVRTDARLSTEQCPRGTDF